MANLMLKKYAAIQSFKLHNFEKEYDVLKNILKKIFFLQSNLVTSLLDICDLKTFFLLIRIVCVYT